MTVLALKLKNATLAFETAQTVMKNLTVSTQRFEKILAELDAEVRQQESYLNNRRMPIDTDLTLASLRNRREKILVSLATLKERAPGAEESLREATERLTDLRALGNRMEEAEGEPATE